MFEPEGVPKCVNRLFERPLKEQIRIHRLAVKLRTEAVNGDDGRSLRFVGVAEDKTVRRLVAVKIGYGKQHALGVRVRAPNFGIQRRNEELAAGSVERTARHDQRSFDARTREETLLETDGKTIEKRSVDGIDRHDADLRFHLVASASPRMRAKLAGGAKSLRVIVGVGIDMAEVARYRFDERKLAWFARKIYTKEEMAYAMRKRNWPERLAGFFAAKEATRKAFGHAIPWRWVGVTHERSGKPAIELRERASLLLERRGVRAIQLSITHTQSVAAAIVILES